MGDASSFNSSATQSTEPPILKGVVLGPDGKPCRTCTSITEWSKLTKTSKPTRLTASPVPISRECPTDVEALGRATWTFLHTTAAYYPSFPSQNHQRQMLGLL